MTQQLTIALAQANFTVGDIQGNTRLIQALATRAETQHQAKLVVFPELALTGYPPEDLLFRDDFHQQIEQALRALQPVANTIDILVGFPEKTAQGIYNAAAYFHQGQLTQIYHKQALPNYGVFDEKRYFIHGNESCLINLNGIPTGILICEDIWHNEPCEQALAEGAKLLIVINASPFDSQKSQRREALIRQRTQQYQIPIMYVHCIGGQDEVVYDGGSFVMDPHGKVTHHAPFFHSDLLPVTLSINEQATPQLLPAKSIQRQLSEEEHVYQALQLGVKDYINKNGFNGALLGLSGGVDSALTLAIACDALGPEHVEAVLMPSRYTADMSVEDAKLMAEGLGVKYHILPIETIFAGFLDNLAAPFHGMPADTTEENLQARIRGMLLMALSNKFGKLVLTTGNKSEMAVGYATLYGDMAGGFAVLKDVYKTLVYRLCDYRNRISPVIPQRIIDRPPTAELAHDQKDEDTLPPYPELDQILEQFIEQDLAVADIIANGFATETVHKVVTMVGRNEYKRRQAPPGVRITGRAFGRERRYPITSGFKP